MSKIRVGIIFGGKSAEHEVSLQSAKNVIDAIDKNKYEVVLIGIDKSGQWLLERSSHYLLHAEDPKHISLNTKQDPVVLIPYEHAGELLRVPNYTPASDVDVVFPVLHGTYGEDGTIQGMLKLLDIPFVGPSVLGSAVGMDKDVMKRLLRDAGIPIADFITISRNDINDLKFSDVVDRLGLPVFVKPANLGSSVGVNKVSTEDEFSHAVSEAFYFDTKILIEEYIKGREIECSVLGNEDPIASLPGEVIPKHEFYSYEAKYIDENGAVVEVPAQLPHQVVERIQELAVKAFKLLCCEGMARIDFFLVQDHKVIINEINTIPGFTNISMYPKLWKASGISYTELIDQLITLAIQRHERDKQLKTSYT